MTQYSFTNPERIAYMTKLVIAAYGSKKKAIKSIEKQIAYYFTLAYEEQRRVSINMTHRILDKLKES